MKRHRVTRHCKSGKCVTYWRGKEGSRRFGEGSEFEKKFSSSRVNRINRAYDEAGVSAPKGKEREYIQSLSMNVLPLLWVL